MKTPNLDHEIERLSLLERTNDLSEYGKELITEYKAIKKALSLHIVSQQRELLAFRKWQKDNWKDVYLYSDEFMINEFKKANCS